MGNAGFTLAIAFPVVIFCTSIGLLSSLLFKNLGLCVGPFVLLFVPFLYSLIQFILQKEERYRKKNWIQGLSRIISFGLGIISVLLLLSEIASKILMFCFIPAVSVFIILVCFDWLSDKQRTDDRWADDEYYDDHEALYQAQDLDSPTNWDIFFCIAIPISYTIMVLTFGAFGPKWLGHEIAMEAARKKDPYYRPADLRDCCGTLEADNIEFWKNLETDPKIKDYLPSYDPKKMENIQVHKWGPEWYQRRCFSERGLYEYVEQFAKKRDPITKESTHSKGSMRAIDDPKAPCLPPSPDLPSPESLSKSPP